MAGAQDVRYKVAQYHSTTCSNVACGNVRTACDKQQPKWCFVAQGCWVSKTGKLYCEVCFATWPDSGDNYTLEKIAENCSCCHAPTAEAVREERRALASYAMGNAPPPPEPRQAFAIQDHLDDARRGVVPRPPPGLVQGLRDEGPELGLLRAKVLDLETRLDRAERAIRDQSDLEGRLLRSETLLKKVCDTMVIDVGDC
jgi:hypothetical protein